MKRVLMGIALVTLVVFGTTYMAQAATLEEAKTLAEKAAAFMKTNGKDKAIAEFNDPKGQWVKGDLYIIAQDYNGIMLANGGNPKLAGQNHLDVKDPNGKFFVKEMISVAKSKGERLGGIQLDQPGCQESAAEKDLGSEGRGNGSLRRLWDIPITFRSDL